MSRKLTAATLALTLAGGVYMTAGVAQASNMGFKLERNFAVVRENPSDPLTGFLNIYQHCYPKFNGLGDVADATFTGLASKCVGDPGGPTAGDGNIDSFDAICDSFTDRLLANGNSFNFSRFNRDTCLFETTSCAKGFTGVTFGGAPFALERGAGFWITVNATSPTPPQNRSVTVGSHDPSWTGRQIRIPASGCIPRQDLIDLDYHSMYQAADEILCGLQGVDWRDDNGDGNPDTCTRGIYDGANLMAIQTFDNINDDSTDTTDNQMNTRTVSFITFPPPGRLAFAGVNFDLTPGDGYQLSISPGHVTTTYISPHF
jgi:hypothetical protein